MSASESQLAWIEKGCKSSEYLEQRKTFTNKKKKKKYGNKSHDENQTTNKIKYTAGICCFNCSIKQWEVALSEEDIIIIVIINIIIMMFMIININATTTSSCCCCQSLLLLWITCRERFKYVAKFLY